ncbi:hypothetical protein [Aeromonas media]|uniref:hypothetical protein n=1 Tax=Aeromonas media TaxID=651 RepID=UPI003D023FEC
MGIGVDFSPFLHAAMAIALQVTVGINQGVWGIGGALGCMWFLAREHTQAEYRWIAMFGHGKRANMPWWGGFDWRVWDMASLLDWLVPVLVCIAVYWVAKYKC